MTLISPEALRGRLDDPALRIADVRWWLADPGRGRRDYDVAHLPGAVFVDLDTDLSAPSGPGRHPLADPRVFARRMEALGLDDASDVVAYDDAAGPSPRACGGCSIAWAELERACWTAGWPPGRRSVVRSRPRSPRIPEVG
jgi:3-mercaptopyruvate sulfurtransferase SseA